MFFFGSDHQYNNGPAMTCPECGGAHFQQRSTLLSSRGAAMFDFDWINPAAQTAICNSCGFILWFLPDAIGDRGQGYQFLNGNLQCPMCSAFHFSTRQTILSTGMGEMFNMDWLKPEADNYICSNCGYILWFLPSAVGQAGQMFGNPQQPFTCDYCGNIHFKQSRALLSTKGATLFDMDWINPEADIFTCTNCGGIEWFLP